MITRAVAVLCFHMETISVTRLSDVLLEFLAEFAILCQVPQPSGLEILLMHSASLPHPFGTAGSCVVARFQHQQPDRIEELRSPAIKRVML